MFVRALLLVAATLCAANVALAQTHTRHGVPPLRVTTATSVLAPTTISRTIVCGATSYTVSIVDGACSVFSNPDADGNPTPPDYAQCENPAGDSAIASCRFGCQPAPTGSGHCLTIRDHR